MGKVVWQMIKRASLFLNLLVGMWILGIFMLMVAFTMLYAFLPVYLGLVPLLFPFIFICPLLLIVASNTRWVARLGQIFNPGTIVVECVDFGHCVLVTLVKDRGDGILTGHAFWSVDVGSLLLMPNGVNSPKSDTSYIYFWQHVDHEKQMIMALQWPEFQSIHSYKHMNHREMIDLRARRYLAIKTDSTYTDI